MSKFAGQQILQPCSVMHSIFKSGGLETNLLSSFTSYKFRQSLDTAAEWP